MNLFADAAAGSLQVGAIAMGLVGGLALFLFGLDQMADSLKIVAGNGLRTILARLTSNRFTGAIAGALVTAIVQSSSVTTVLVVGFVSAGLMTVAQSIAVVIGANVGTTVTAQIVAFKITQYALLLIAAGFAMSFVFSNRTVRLYGRTLMGLGLILFGMLVMSEATGPLRDYEPFRDLMQQMDHALIAILVAAGFTAVVQSSSATTGLVIALALHGNIALEAGIALTLGANIGTCVTALLASIGKPPEAVRVAVVHILFNVVGVALWLAFIPQLAELVRWISPAHPDLSGMARRAAETPRQIANAHTVFNVANTFVFIWFTAPLAWLVRRLVPDRPPRLPEESRPKYLETAFLQTPAVALEMVHKELARLGASVHKMLHRSLDAAVRGNQLDLERLEAMDDPIDHLNGEIVTYLGRLSQENLAEDESQQLQNYVAVANYLESIGDVIETNMVEAGMKRFKHHVYISPATLRALRQLHEQICWSLEASLTAIATNDVSLAKRVIAAKSDVNQAAQQCETHLLKRLVADEPNRLNTFQVETDFIEILKRIYYFAKRIARIVAGLGAFPQQVDADQKTATQPVASARPDHQTESD